MVRQCNVRAWSAVATACIYETWGFRPKTKLQSVVGVTGNPAKEFLHYFVYTPNS